MNVLISILLWFLPTTDPQDCDLKRNEDGIKVYTCKSEGERLKSLRAEFFIKNVTIDQLESFLLDVEGYTKWQYNMIEAGILKKTDDHNMLYRTVVHAPWPVEDRELIVQYNSKRDTLKQTMDITIVNAKIDYPKDDNLVRVPSSYGTWHVETHGNDLRVEYALRIDPGGSIPAWLINIAVADGPHHSFRNLKRLIER